MSEERYQELRAEMRGRGRAVGLAIACLIDHAAAIGTYEERLATEPDAATREVMANTQVQEFLHFARDLEYLVKAIPAWRTAIEHVVAETPPSVAPGRAL
jgi:hypothetical protein